MALGPEVLIPSGAARQLPLINKGSLWGDENLSACFADTVSLRLGHGAALVCHRHTIHSRDAASLPWSPRGGLKGAMNDGIS